MNEVCPFHHRVTGDLSHGVPGYCSAVAPALYIPTLSDARWCRADYVDCPQYRAALAKGRRPEDAFLEMEDGPVLVVGR